MIEPLGQLNTSDAPITIEWPHSVYSGQYLVLFFTLLYFPSITSLFIIITLGTNSCCNLHCMYIRVQQHSLCAMGVASPQQRCITFPKKGSSTQGTCRWTLHLLVNRLHNILLKSVPWVAVLVPPSSSMAAVSKAFTQLPQKCDRSDEELSECHQSHVLRFGKCCSMEKLIACTISL